MRSTDIQTSKPFIEDLGRDIGGEAGKVTTMAIGEESGSDNGSVTTASLGEEGGGEPPAATTLALGEENGNGEAPGAIHSPQRGGWRQRLEQGGLGGDLVRNLRQLIERLIDMIGRQTSR